MSRIIVDNLPTTGKTHDKFGQMGKGDFDIHNVHSCHVETVCLLGRRKPDDTIKASVNMDDYYQIRDAGCSVSDVSEIIRMYETGSMKNALHMMRKNRCVLMDELHESGRKIDCLDLLIRRMEKEMKQADNKNGGI